MGVTHTTYPNGDPVRVETGIGRVKAIGDRAKRNVPIEIDAEHLKEGPLKAWVDKEGPLWPRVQAAFGEDGSRSMRIWYRIDVHRRGSAQVAPGTPFADLGNRDKVRDLVGFEKPENAQTEQQITGGAPAAPAAQTAVAGAAQNGGSAPAPAHSNPTPDPATPEPDTAPPTLNQVLLAARQAARDGNATKVAALMAQAAQIGGTEEQIASATASLPADTLERMRDGTGVRPHAAETVDDPDGTGPSIAARSGLSARPNAAASDGRPWEPLNSDGRVNLSSYAAGAVLESVELAARLLINRARALHADDPDTYPTVTAPKPRAVDNLARTLLTAADAVQVWMRRGGDTSVKVRVNRQDASHKFARRCVREALDAYPPPFGQRDPKVMTDWQRNLAEHALALGWITLGILEDRDPIRDQTPPRLADAQAAAETGA